MFKQMTLLGLGVISALTLTACTMTSTTTVNNNRFTRRLVEQKTLANGQSLMIGQRAPDAANGCSLKASVDSSYLQDKFKGQMALHMGDGTIQYLQKQAVAYANVHGDINYAYIDIPTTHTAGIASGNESIDISADRTVTTRYYDCSNPPAKNSNPFKG